MLAQVCNVVQTTSTMTQRVFLNEERVFPAAYNEGTWLLDTGATNHMTGCRSSLASLDESVRGSVRFGDGSRVEICGIGAVTIAGKNQDHKVLSEVYYIPSLKCNIVSLGQLEEGGCRVEIDDGVMQVFERRQDQNQPRAVLIKAERRNRLYTMKVNLTKPVCLLTKMEEEAWLWHARYGHLNFRSLRELGAKEMVEGMLLIRRAEQVCDGCALGKQHRAPFPRASAYRAENCLELVHGDLCGHITPPTPGGKSFFLLVVDDCSRYMWLELLASKSEALQYFRKIKMAAEVESGHRLKAFRSDRGGEFNSGAFIDFCDEHGIKHNTTAPYSPQQNGVVERRNQTVVEMARCLLKSMQVPGKYWGEAVKAAVYILNRSPTKSLNGKTPFEAWFGKKPGVKHLRTFGCLAYIKKVGPGVTKLSDRSITGVFFGYEPGTKGYRVYDPVNNKLMVTRDVVFDEKRGWNWVESSSSQASDPAPFTFRVQYSDEPEQNPTIGNADLTGDSDAEPGSPAAAIPSPATEEGSTPPAAQIQWATPPSGASASSDEAPRRFRTITDLLDTTEEVQDFEYSGFCLSAVGEPRSVKEAMTELCWRQAMQAEM